ncbi:hypothetical protein DRH29_05090 [candidate division Kazan bacterium]|uniref:Uncharacterized protein n=1 Tax=candidate division Kazan bacterium TaxID=2202143 RepID=A0A420ZBC3_UNCK3|nr:MAG: hypothetical protein DRH29_05090 [candidate division Kazan bacterium]
MSWGFVLPGRENGKFVWGNSRAMIQVHSTQRILSRAEAQGRGGWDGVNCVVLCGFVALCEALFVPVRGAGREPVVPMSVNLHLGAWTRGLRTAWN